MKMRTLKKIVKFFKGGGMSALLNMIFPFPLRDFIRKLLGKESFLTQVEFHLVDHCNLNCAHCDHFSPLAEKNFVDIKEVEKDFTKLRKIFDRIGKIYILGGEPLLHPNITEVFKPLRNLYPQSEIIIITNGIMLDKLGENFWQELRNYDITLSMTEYPLNIDYKKYIEKCDSLGIKSYFFSMGRARMQKMNLDYKGRSSKNRAFEKCTRKRCHFIRDSKLYICTPAPNIEFLNRYFKLNFPLTKRDYIDLDREKSASKINYLLSKPINFCRYCSDKSLDSEKYRVSNKTADEWINPETLPHGECQ